jgi:ribosomal protein S18 acetylase RimI-like enzyme
MLTDEHDPTALLCEDVSSCHYVGWRLSGGSAEPAEEMTLQMSSTDSHPVLFRISSRAEADRVLSCVTLGFAADPVARWLYPEPASFLAHFPRVLELFAGRAFEHSAAYRNDDFTAAALWLPPGVHSEEEALSSWFAITVAEEKLARVFSLFEQMDRYQPKEPCWHLADIAVDPSQRGKGLGAALLDKGLQQCDRDGIPAYLESTNPANVSLYKRHGFEQIGLIETDGAPQLVPMVRAAR